MRKRGLQGDTVTWGTSSIGIIRGCSRSGGFSSLQQYEQLSASLGNVVIMPPGAIKAGSYEVNSGLPTKAASAAEITSVLNKRAARLIRIYRI